MEDYLKGFITLKNIIITDEIAGEYILELLCITNIAGEYGIYSAVAEREKWQAGDYVLENGNAAGKEADDAGLGEDIFKPDTVMISSDPFMLKLASEKGLATVGVYEPGTEPDMDVKCDILVEGMDDVDIYFLDRISKRKEKLP